MAELENHIVQQTNINFIPEGGFRIADIPLGEIGLSMMDIYGAENEPATTQLPDLAIVALPSARINITLLPQNGRIVVTDESITNYSSRDNEKFLRLITALKEKHFSQENNFSISSFGQNVISTFDIKGYESNDSGKYLFESFLADNEAISSLGDVLASGFMIAYKQDEFRCQLRLDPRFSKNNSFTKSIRSNFNFHSDCDFPTDLSSFTDFWDNAYQTLGKDLAKLIK